MPAWILILTKDHLRLPELEEAARLAGFSPRRAPDLPRARVLFLKGDPPGALLIDLSSVGEEGLDVLKRLGEGLPAVVLTPRHPRDWTQRAHRAGATTLDFSAEPEVIAEALVHILVKN